MSLYLKLGCLRYLDPKNYLKLIKQIKFEYTDISMDIHTWVKTFKQSRPPLKPDSTVTVVTSCHFSNFWNSGKFKFLLQFLLKLFLLLQVLTWFYKKNPKTPLRNRKCHPELLRRWFQDHLKIDILQQNWSQKLSLWPKIHFFYTFV